MLRIPKAYARRVPFGGDMSIVIAIAWKDKSLVASDGLAIDGSGKIVDENYQKFRRISKNVIIGYGGDMFPAETILNFTFDSSDNGITLPQAYRKLLNTCNDTINGLTKKITVQFTVCGKNKYGIHDCMAISIVNNIVEASGRCKKKYPHICIADSGHVENASQTVTELIDFVDGDITSHVQNAIHWLSQYDETVNDHVFLEFV